MLTKKTTYVQFGIIDEEIWMYTRIGDADWYLSIGTEQITAENGYTLTFTTPKKIFHSDEGKFYAFFRSYDLMWYARGTTPHKMLAVVTAGHPLLSRDNFINFAMINKNGEVHKADETRINNSLNIKTGSYMNNSSMERVYTPKDGFTVRLVAFSQAEPFRIGFATFNKTTLDLETATYGVATWDRANKVWNVDDNICKIGSFLSPSTNNDGSQSYVGGIDFYNGNGVASIISSTPVEYESDRVYISRFNTEKSKWVLESYITKDNGLTHELEEVIAESDSANDKIYRPLVPLYADDNMPVYWHRGFYNGHTGGWHCDAVANVEYDV